MQPEVPMPITRFTRFLSALFPFLTRCLPFVVSRAAVPGGGPSRTTPPPHPARPSGTRAPASASCQPAAQKIATSTRPRIPAPLQGEPGSAGACTPPSRAAPPAAPAPPVPGAPPPVRGAFAPVRGERVEPRTERDAPRRVTPGPQPCPAPHPRHPDANRHPVVPRPTPNPAPKRPAAPSVIPANPSVIPAPAGIQPPHPGAPNPAKMRPAAPSVVPATAGIRPPHPGAPNPAEKRPAAPQEFFRKNSYCAREARFRALRTPRPVQPADPRGSVCRSRLMRRDPTVPNHPQPIAETGDNRMCDPPPGRTR